MLERKKLRVWNAEGKYWEAPAYEDGGPEFHNRHTYSNWYCHCPDCTYDNLLKWKERQQLEDHPDERAD